MLRYAGMGGNLAKNTVYLTAASVAQKALAFLYFMLLARVMMPERTGTYFLALSLTTIFSVLTDFGITPVVIREIAKQTDRAPELIRQALGIKLPCIVLGIVGSVLAAWILGYNPIILQLMCLAALVMAADAISLLYYGALRGFHALQFESLGIFLGQLCTMLLGGAALLFYPSLHVLVIVLIAGSVLNAVFSAWQVVRRLGPSVLVPAWDRVQAKRLLSVAFPFALAGIFVKVYSYVDTVFLSLYLGTAAVGVYSVAYKFTYAFQFLPMAFVAALYPGMSALAAGDRRRLGELFDRSMWYMA
ncbi:flippase, partial [Candidatus Uhrbacteria bacterium]|nr:flippase [Candidatus Uhrbacteria bacterium]